MFQFFIFYGLILSIRLCPSIEIFFLHPHESLEINKKKMRIDKFLFSEMMQLAVLVMAVLVQVNGRIVFPDEFEAMSKQYQQSTVSDGSPPSDDSFNVGETFSPLPGEYSGPSFAPASIAAAPSSSSQDFDYEAQYWNNHVSIFPRRILD